MWCTRTDNEPPRPELGGLEIGVEIKYGENLQDTQTWQPREVV